MQRGDCGCWRETDSLNWRSVLTLFARKYRLGLDGGALTYAESPWQLFSLLRSSAKVTGNVRFFQTSLVVWYFPHRASLSSLSGWNIPFHLFNVWVSRLWNSSLHVSSCLSHSPEPSGFSFFCRFHFTLFFAACIRQRLQRPASAWDSSALDNSLHIVYRHIYNVYYSLSRHPNALVYTRHFSSKNRHLYQWETDRERESESWKAGALHPPSFHHLSFRFINLFSLR